MSAKLKSGNGFVRLLLSHGEKIGIVAVLACAGMLIYRSLGRERLGDNQQPPVITTSATSAETKVRNLTIEDLPPESRLNAASAKIHTGADAMQKVRVESFPNMDHALDAPVIKSMKLRTDPVLLPVTGIEVRSGSGLWASDDPEAIRRRYLKQIEEQEERRMELQAERERRDRARRNGGPGEFGESEMMGERGMMGSMRGMSGVSNVTDSGAMVIQPQGGAMTQGFETIRSRSWATVLAKVPIQAQVNLYNDAFEEARGFNPDRDMPEYLGYFVQRAEVTDEGTGEFKTIATVNDRYVIKVIGTWPIETPEVINPKYKHPLLTFPLPPMALRAWGKDATHSDLPIPSREDLYGARYQQLEEQQQEVEEPEVDPNDPFSKPGIDRRGGRFREFEGEGFGGRPGRGRGMRGRGSMGMGPGMSYGRGDMEDGGMMGMPMMGRGDEMEGGYGGYGGLGSGRGGYGRGAGGMVELPPYVWDFETEFLLFRYFDTTVKPGHRYRYRIQLALRDPNKTVKGKYLVPKKYLAPEVTTRLEEQKGSFLLTEPSDPSPIVSVPLTGLIYVAGAEEANESNYNSEPEARLLIKTLDALHTAEVALARDFTRGSVVNVLDHADVIFARRFEVEEGQKEPKFSFETGITLLDFDGGGAISSKNRALTVPARALLMDSAGRLIRQGELDDTETVDQYDMIMDAAKKMEKQRKQDAENVGGGFGFDEG